MHLKEKKMFNSRKELEDALQRYASANYAYEMSASSDNAHELEKSKDAIVDTFFGTGGVKDFNECFEWLLVLVKALNSGPSYWGDYFRDREKFDKIQKFLAKHGEEW